MPKIASFIWSDMQGAGHAAVVVYRKCPETKADPAKGRSRRVRLFWVLACR